MKSDKENPGIRKALYEVMDGLLEVANAASALDCILNRHKGGIDLDSLLGGNDKEGGHA